MTKWLNVSISQLAPLLRERRISPVELARDSLARIHAENPRLNAFLTVMEESAMKEARRAEQEIGRGRYRGPLHGIPVSVKDLFYTRGVPTTAGSKILAGFVPRSDAAAVRRLRAAGAVLLGKTALHEFAYGVTNENAHFGPTRNPHDPSRIPGGSSGGSAVAVATGMGFASLGTDTGGSIRIPASLCGVVGLKPTFELSSRRGVVPLGATLDHVGPLARSVEDLALVLDAIMDRSPRGWRRREAQLLEGVRGLRIGVSEKYFFERIQPEVEQAVRQALGRFEGWGAHLHNVHVPDAEAATLASRNILLAEAAAYHRRYRARRQEYGQEVRRLIEAGEALAPAELIEARRVRARFTRELDRLFERVDVLITPTTPATATLIGQRQIEIEGVSEDTRLAMTRLLRAFNMAGVPALSVPCGRDHHGLPIGMQIVGRRLAEVMVLRVGIAWEREATASSQ